MTSLLEAAFNGDVEAVQAFIAKGVPADTPNKYGLTPLHCCADIAHITPLEILEIVKALLGAGANPNVAAFEGGTPLMFHSTDSTSEAVEALLDGGVDPFARNASGGTGLCDRSRAVGHCAYFDSPLWVHFRFAHHANVRGPCA